MTEQATPLDVLVSLGLAPTDARRILEALEAAGWQMVPIDPTGPMTAAIEGQDFITTSLDGDENTYDFISEEDARGIWATMLGNAPGIDGTRR
ncbi:hypothetical protein J8J14_21145 [Roseomonas sp. SSH11]|uniref:Uncharacterized protein n=1 Tax=Pararoseomonas baculiformis TaxID=2820812 RepID=A0ABS4AJT5_9PROT|nr:hypothetical protein [Pararoseomonas baculiformis]MBP0447282.1 hypothetical protein [Pararoseomonas baculiformis]